MGSKSSSGTPSDLPRGISMRPHLSSEPGPVPSQLPEPPNGGLQAWLQVLGSFFLFLSSSGLTVSFGVWEDYLKSTFLSDYSESAISWIGTTQGFLIVVVGIVTGPIFDLGYLRPLTIVGLTLNVLGFLAASVARQYYTTFISLGVIVGLGAGCLFTPSLAIVSQYFTTKRSAVTGITAAGGSVGGVIFPIAFHKITASLGYGWANRTFGFFILAVLSISLAVLKPRIQPDVRRKLFDRTAITDPCYILFSLALFSVWTGLYLPYFYMPLYTRNILQASENFSSYMLALLSAGSVLGRILMNVLADKLGAFQLLLPCTFVTGCLGFVWIGIRSPLGAIAFCVLYGFFAGAIVSLAPFALVTISPDLSIVGTRMGMSFGFASFGLLIGSPIGGTLLKTNAGFTAVQVFCGTLVTVGFATCTLSGLEYRKRMLHEVKASSV